MCTKLSIFERKKVEPTANSINYYLPIVFYLAAVSFLIHQLIKIRFTFIPSNYCPRCKNENTDRIKSSFFFSKLPWINAKHYVCYKCHKTYYKFLLKKR